MMKLFIFMAMSSSSLVCMESKSWWEYWIFLEINSLAFILYMLKEKKKEKVFIFLLFQTLASTLFMVFVFFSSWSVNESSSKTTFLIMLTSIMMKIGMFPFHSWMVKVVNNLSWILLMILFSWQKLVPLLILMKMLEKTKMIFWGVIVSIFMLNFIIIKMTNIKKMVTVSSLMHNTWMIIPLLILKELSMMYLLSYSLILLPLLLNIAKMNTKNILQQTPIKMMKKEMKLSMMSISGIPPSIGFFFKMAVLVSMLKLEKKTFSISVLMMSTCVAFFVYLQMFIKYFLLEKMKNMKKNYFYKKNEIKEASWTFIFMPLLVWV